MDSSIEIGKLPEPIAEEESVVRSWHTEVSAKLGEWHTGKALRCLLVRQVPPEVAELRLRFDPIRDTGHPYHLLQQRAVHNIPVVELTEPVGSHGPFRFPLVRQVLEGRSHDVEAYGCPVGAHRPVQDAIKRVDLLARVRIPEWRMEGNEKHLVGPWLAKDDVAHPHELFVCAMTILDELCRGVGDSGEDEARVAGLQQVLLQLARHDFIVLALFPEFPFDIFVILTVVYDLPVDAGMEAYEAEHSTVFCEDPIRLPRGAEQIEVLLIRPRRVLLPEEVDDLAAIISGGHDQFVRCVCLRAAEGLQGEMSHPRTTV